MIDLTILKAVFSARTVLAEAIQLNRSVFHSGGSREVGQVKAKFKAGAV